MLIAAVGEVLGGYSTILKSPVSFDKSELQISCARIFLNTYFRREMKKAGNDIEASVHAKNRKFFTGSLRWQLFL